MDLAKVVRVGYADLMVTQFGFSGGTLGDRIELTFDHQAEFTVERHALQASRTSIHRRGTVMAKVGTVLSGYSGQSPAMCLLSQP